MRRFGGLVSRSETPFPMQVKGGILRGVLSPGCCAGAGLTTRWGRAAQGCKPGGVPALTTALALLLSRLLSSWGVSPTLMQCRTLQGQHCRGQESTPGAVQGHGCLYEGSEHRSDTSPNPARPPLWCSELLAKSRSSGLAGCL